MNLVYDAGALIAAKRNSRRFAALHRRATMQRIRPLVPAAVLAQVWTGKGPRQTLLARTLIACRIQSLDETQARRIGAMRTASGNIDVVDISVVELAMRHRATVLTSDSHIETILDALHVKLAVDYI